MSTSSPRVPLPSGFPEGASLPAVVIELGEMFAAAGRELSLVGGPVRDLFIGRDSGDLDFTTDADPDAIEAIGKGWADPAWAWADPDAASGRGRRRAGVPLGARIGQGGSCLQP